MGSEVVEHQDQVEAVREAFEREFERFARFRDSEAGTAGSTLDEAEAALRELADLRTRHTGKKSALSTLMKTIGRVPADERGAFAQRVQQVGAGFGEALDAAEASLKRYISAARVECERIDVTLPGRRPRQGHVHPINIIRQRLEDVFVSMGYSVEDGREIETDFYNFTALNIPELHPARSLQDTFYTTDGLSLRSQTSTVQIHAMQRRRPPLRIIAPGRVFRRDTPDATHNPMFFQLEGLVIDRGIHICAPSKSTPKNSPDSLSASALIACAL
ncbi:MAG: hypothetical protein LC754_05030 [Acidobacteria bacterium]|nr:hypothetical protein [Acidobacteriota bacterium]